MASSSELLLAQSERLHSLADLLEEKAKVFYYDRWDSCVFGFALYHMGRRKRLIDKRFDPETFGQRLNLTEDDLFNEVFDFYGLPSPSEEVWFRNWVGCSCVRCQSAFGKTRALRKIVIGWGKKKHPDLYDPDVIEAHGWVRVFRLLAKLKALQALKAQSPETMEVASL